MITDNTTVMDTRKAQRLIDVYVTAMETAAEYDTITGYYVDTLAMKRDLQRMISRLQRLIDVSTDRDMTVWRKIADMVEVSEAGRAAWRRQYAEQVERLRQAYNLAQAGNRVALTPGGVATGAENDLLDMQDGETVLVGWIDQNGEFQPELYFTNVDDFAVTLYWQGYDVASEADDSVNEY